MTKMTKMPKFLKGLKSLFNFDAFAKSLKMSFGVIPAKAEIQFFQILLDACYRIRSGTGFAEPAPAKAGA